MRLAANVLRALKGAAFAAAVAGCAPEAAERDIAPVNEPAAILIPIPAAVPVAPVPEPHVVVVATAPAAEVEAAPEDLHDEVLSRRKRNARVFGTLVGSSFSISAVGCGRG